MTIEDILAQVKPLAVAYYQLTGKPLGVTGEVGEFEVARLLGLKLEAARSPGYDAKDRSGRRYQIKTRSLDDTSLKKTQNTGKLNDKDWDAALLCTMTLELEVREIWEADRADIDRELSLPGSRGRNERRQLSLSKFKEIGRLRYHPADTWRS